MTDILTFAASSSSHWHVFLVAMLIPMSVLLVGTEMFVKKDCGGASVIVVIILCVVGWATWDAVH